MIEDILNLTLAYIPEEAIALRKIKSYYSERFNIERELDIVYPLIGLDRVKRSINNNWLELADFLISMEDDKEEILKYIMKTSNSNALLNFRHHFDMEDMFDYYLEFENQNMSKVVYELYFSDQIPQLHLLRDNVNLFKIYSTKININNSLYYEIYKHRFQCFNIIRFIFNTNKLDFEVEMLLVKYLSNTEYSQYINMNYYIGLF